MTDERNFRSSYYEKVGCRGVEEKKTLEILMKEKPWDRVKLKQFCLRFTVFADYRNLVWKVLLDILPVYPDSYEYVMKQRTEQYQDLLYAVEKLQLIEPSEIYDGSGTPQSKVFLEMWVLENEEWKPPIFPETNFNSADTFLPIAKTLRELYDDPVDVYWFSKRFTEVVKNMQKDLNKLKEAFYNMLDKQDGELYIIWDKVCSGAPKILAYAAVMLVITLRRNILKAKNADEVVKCVTGIPKQCEEVVANKAIDLWQYYGAQPQSDQLAKK